MTGPSQPTYAALVREAAERSPHAEALVFPDVRVTYGELLERATWRARELRVLGVGAGHRFGVLMPNSPDIVELLIGGAMLGAAMVPINTRFKSRELAHVVADAEITTLFTTDEIDEHVNFKELLADALPGLAEAADPWRLDLAAAPRLRSVVLVGERDAPGFLAGSGVRAAAEGQAAPGPADEPAPDDVAIVLYTSGTTANPKGCMLTHSGVVLNARGIAERFAVPADDRWWDPLPMFHAGALLLMSGCFVAGATYISMQRFDVDVAFEQIALERPTVLYPLFPTITLTLMHDPRFADQDLGAARVIVSVAPPDVQLQIQQAFAPATLMSAYGITELGGTVAFTLLDDTLEVRTTSCGLPLPGFEMRVVDGETNVPLLAGERGELVGRGLSRFDGYYGNPEQTHAVIDAEGYFHTGDLCSMDEDGHIFFHGRLKDMLKVGGENVAAIEIESFLATHPGIKLAQVVGVPDARLLEVPAAFVELSPGYELDEDAVVAYCKGQIAGFKVPRYVRFVEEWPMSATKVQKFVLRDRLLESLSMSGAGKGS